MRELPKLTEAELRLVRQRLLELAAQNQEIELCNPAALDDAAGAKPAGIAPTAAPDRQQWLESLRQLREHTASGRPGRTSDEILAEDRADRD